MNQRVIQKNFFYYFTTMSDSSITPLSYFFHDVAYFLIFEFDPREVEEFSDDYVPLWD